MDKERLDARTVDRILSGKMEPGEGGARAAALTNLLHAAAAPVGAVADPAADLLAAMSTAVVAGAGSSVSAPRRRAWDAGGIGSGPGRLRSRSPLRSPSAPGLPTQERSDPCSRPPHTSYTPSV